MVGLASVIALLAMFAVGASSASALIRRGHVFSSSFGQVGSGPGQFNGPTGVAVDEKSGDLYVVDAGNERVEIFAPDGSGGYVFASEFLVRSPTGAIAVDNSKNASDPSSGNVYVVGSKEKEAEPEEHEVVYEYSPTSKEIIHRWTIFKAKVGGETEELELENISGVSVDANGVLWVYWETEGIIDGFTKEAAKTEKARLVWQPSLRREPEIELKFECPARHVFATAPAGDAFFAGYERKNSEEGCPGEFLEPPDPTVVAKLDNAQPSPRAIRSEVSTQNTTGAAVDQTNGDVYLDNATSIGAFTAAGAPIQRFGQGQIANADGIAVDAQRGNVFVAEPGENKIAVFGPEGPGAPLVDALSAKSLSPSSTELRAQIDPHGHEAEYHFQYGTSDCVVSPSSCTDLPTVKVASSFGDQEVHVVVEGLTPATAYYYRLILTSSAGTVEAAPTPNTFTTLPSPSVMPDGRGWELVSPPNKHGAAPEVISPFRGGSIQVSNDGNAIAWLATGPVVTEPEGNRGFEFTQLLSRREPGAWSTVSLETLHEEGRGIHSPSPTEYHYFSRDLSQALLQPTEPFGTLETPPLAPGATEKTMYVRATPPAAPNYDPLVTPGGISTGAKFGGKLEFLDATEDLKHVLFESRVALTAGAPASGGLYEWEVGSPLRLISVLPNGEPATNESNASSVIGNAGGLNPRNALSSDGTRVLWSPGDTRHLYLRDTSVGATGQTILINAAQGQESTEPGEGGHTVPQPPESADEVIFQTASSDGSKVFFTDTAKLTEDSTLDPAGEEEQPADLYEFELTSAPGEPLKGRLHDLTAESSAGPADVLNLIPGSSADGSRTYFVANGVLAPGASRGECPRDLEGEGTEGTPVPPDATCNLYVVEPDQAHPGQHVTRFIAALSAQDAADWGEGPTSELAPTHGNLSNVTSRVSPDGRYLTFMSQQSLTGYDNSDAVSGEADEEVYLYDAQTQRLLCASCNSGMDGGSWQRPQGVLDSADSGEGSGLLIDRPKLWANRWLAGSIPGWAFNVTSTRATALYQPRYLSNDGRLYFNSSDALVAQDVNGKADVYQYEPSGIGDCHESGGCVGLISSGTGTGASAFLDADENGHDVFFVTANRLVPTDTDGTFDIYDARVCEASSPCIVAKAPSNEECTSTSACREASTAPPPLAAPPASTATGDSGNIAEKGVAGVQVKTPTKAKPLTRAQKLAKALKACKKLKSKHKRGLCERQARKRFGAKAKPKTKTKSKSAHKGSAR